MNPDQSFNPSDDTPAQPAHAPGAVFTPDIPNDVVTPNPAVNDTPAMPIQPVVPAPASTPAQTTFTPQPPLPDATPMIPDPDPQVAYAPQAPALHTTENPDKSYLVALMLSYFLGSLGVDRFYLGKVKSGIIKLLTLGGFGIWSLIDLILIGFGRLTAKNDDRKLQGFAHDFHWVKITTIILVIFNTLILAGLLLLLVLGVFASQQADQRSLEYNTNVEDQTINLDTPQ